MIEKKRIHDYFEKQSRKECYNYEKEAEEKCEYSWENGDFLLLFDLWRGDELLFDMLRN